MNNSYGAHFKKAKAAASKNLTEAEVEAQLRKAFGMKENPSTRLSQKSSNHGVKRKKADFPLYPLISVSALMLGLLSYSIFPEKFERIFERIEIGYMGQAKAQPEGKKSPGPKPMSEEKVSADKSKELAAEKEIVPEDLSYLSKLRDRKTALDLREAELNQLEEELQRQKAEIESRIVELTKIREEISNKLEDRVEADEGKVKKLVELYSSMKPKQAAKIIETINTDLAVEVLANMKKKSAADIMNVIDDKVAKELSERLTGYKRTPASKQ